MTSRLVLLAHGQFSPFGSKTANCILRYRGDEVVAVLDRDGAGRTAASVLGYGGDVPVLPAFADCARLAPTELVVGIAPPGGMLPPAWRADILEAIEAGMDVTSGLHLFLGDDPEIREAALRRGVRLRDLRRPPEASTLPTGRLREAPFRICLTVGTDCNVGKMSASLEIARHAAAAGRRAVFAATGQTGIFLAGRGICVDRVVSDFVAGATESLVLDAASAVEPAADLVIVEGQGSLSHPAYSGVTLSLLHGAMPHLMVLCHHLGRRDHAHYPGWPLPSVATAVDAYERLASLVRPARVVAVAANGVGLSGSLFAREAADLERELGLPVADPYSDVGGGIGRLVGAVLDAAAALPTTATAPA